MQMKLVRIKDDGTTINALAIKFSFTSEMERQMLVQHTGHRADGNSVLLVELDSERCTTDPIRWAAMNVHRNTLPVAHALLERNFDRFPDGRINDIDIAEVLEARLDPSRRDGASEE
jgi:hypothetical protein